MKTDPAVERYIESIPVPWQKRICIKLRKLVRLAEPELEERIAWGSPGFFREGLVAWMYSGRDWVNLSFPQGASLGAPEGVWEAGLDGAAKARRTMRFRAGQPLPESFIVDLVERAVRRNIESRRVTQAAGRTASRHFELSERLAESLRGQGLLEAFSRMPFHLQRRWATWVEEGLSSSDPRERRMDLMLAELEACCFPLAKEERKGA